MRPNQNRRMRGRNRNNNGGSNKGPNPLTRSYESNGPDVKIRGTAQNVADKYAQLARDAQSSGDPVAAENYFQHAEHYYRIIAGAQEQYRQQYGAPQRNGFDDDEDGDDEGAPNGFGNQPAYGQEYGDDYAEGGPSPRGAYQDARQDRDARGDRDARSERDPRDNRAERQDARPNRFNDRPERRDRFQNRERPAQGGNRQDGPRQDYARQDGPRQDGFRHDGPRQDAPRQDASRFEGEPPRPAPVSAAEPYVRPEPRRERRREEAPAEIDGAGGLPAFLTAPVRSAPPAEEPAAPEAAFTDGAEAPAPRPRRRRRARFEGTEGGAPAADLLSPDPSTAE